MMSSNVKPKTGGLAAILRLEKERRAQEEKEELSSLVSESATAINAPPVVFVPPVNSVAAKEFIPAMNSADGTIRTGHPLQNEPAKESGPPTKSKGAVLLPIDTPHLRTPHEITDRIMPTLKPGCQVVLMRLYRLSAGFGSNICHVSVPKLASSCNISETQIRIFLRVLEQRKLIRRLSIDLANKVQSDRGITFEVLLPRLATTKSVAGTKNVGGGNFESPTNSEPNKVNTLKENTQNQESLKLGGWVGSKFTIEECRKYAKHLQSTGQGINNPGGYATTIHRTGEADMLIDNFLHPEAADSSSILDTNQCPDCKGTGFYYPQGVEAGVTRCKHNQLRKEAQ